MPSVLKKMNVIIKLIEIIRLCDGVTESVN